MQQIKVARLLADKKNIEIYFDPEELPQVSFDIRAISKVLGNFIGNAVKFSSPQSKILITTENLKDSVRLPVRDEGPGLSIKDQQQLFKKFQTLTARPTGGEKYGELYKVKIFIFHFNLCNYAFCNGQSEWRSEFPFLPRTAIHPTSAS